MLRVLTNGRRGPRALPEPGRESSGRARSVLTVRDPRNPAVQRRCEQRPGPRPLGPGRARRDGDLRRATTKDAWWLPCHLIWGEGSSEIRRFTLARTGVEMRLNISWMEIVSLELGTRDGEERAALVCS